MSITLYKHNEQAYRAALTMLRATSKAVIIHPTGTGKSFIGFKFCEDFPQWRVSCFPPRSTYSKLNWKTSPRTVGPFRKTSPS